MKKKFIVLFVLFLLAISASAYANSISIGVKASTLGPGGEGEIKITDSIGVRVGVNYYTYSYSGTEGDIGYDFDLKLMNAPILIDWHPFKGSFRLSAGAVFNGNELDAKATPLVDTTIGGIPFTPAEIGTLNAKIDFNSISPYLSMGWDTSFGKESGFGFTFELGALFQGEPDASLTATGSLSGDPTFLAELAAEEQELQDALDNFTIYPVVGFGINYRF